MREQTPGSIGFGGQQAYIKKKKMRERKKTGYAILVLVVRTIHNRTRAQEGKAFPATRVTQDLTPV